ncbi:MAG: M28 family peptidase, partial [Gemmatimonadetes bacterium]|nr:M28 family peptidase [Gemmatimonadota bacterium]
TAADLRTRLFIVADDSMRGRLTGSPGMRATSDYIVRELTRLGVRPAGDNGTYLARVPVTRDVNAITASARSAAGAEVAVGSTDLGLLSGVGGLPGHPRPSGEGPVVFGGYMADPGITAAQELQPAQLQGAALVVRYGAVPGTTPTSMRLDLGRLIGPASPLAALFLVVEGSDLEQAWSYVRSSSGSMKLASAAGADTTGGGGPAVFLITPAAAERLTGQPLAGARQPRAGLGTFRYALNRSTQQVDAWNVVGVIPGSDPRRAGEYVAVGAHYDHIGVTDPVNGDSIDNGADDDGSGTVSVLEIVERFASLPQARRPARSILAVWHVGEEEGLLGSEYFTDHPTVARDSIVAQLNIDMIGRNSPDSLYLVGSRRVSTALGTLVEAANARQAHPFRLDYTFDAPGHPEQIYCRSDHYSYARYGIPVTFFTTGLHPDYHKPSDEPQKIDYDKLARVASFIGDALQDVGNAAARPKVDQPVPPLGTPCKQ